MRPVLLLGLLLLGSVGGCSFNEDGVSAGALDGKVTPPDDARDEQGRPIDGRVDGPADGGGGGDADADGQPPAADSTADTVAPDSTVDTVAPDSTVDTVAPDSSVDSGPPVYIDESFTNGAGSLSSNRGSWSYQGGSATQSETTSNGPNLTGSMSVADYTVDSVVRIHGIQGLGSAAEGAGVAARVQQPKPGNPQEPRQSYACWLAVDHGRVYLTETSGTDGIWTPLASSGAVTIFLNTPYRVLLTVQGNQIRCSVPTLSVQLSANDSTITSAGNAGLFTVYAHASWEYLKVTGP